VDLSFFASDGSRRKTAPRPTQIATVTKGIASSVKGSGPIPNGLITPKEFKTTEKLRTVDNKLETKMSVDPPSDSVVPETAEKPNPSYSTQAKRTVEQMENGGSTSNVPQGIQRPQGKERPQQAKPPVKRQKQAPSLFIPKKVHPAFPASLFEVSYTHVIWCYSVLARNKESMVNRKILYVNITRTERNKRCYTILPSTTYYVIHYAML
jgi:hypothetical protein